MEPGISPAWSGTGREPGTSPGKPELGMVQGTPRFAFHKGLEPPPGPGDRGMGKGRRRNPSHSTGGPAGNTESAAGHTWF